MSEFKDRNGEECSIQESSIATEPCIWLGCDEINFKTFHPGKGWLNHSDENLKSVFNAESVLVNNWMHLTRKQVKALLPLLTRFVETGGL